MIHKLLCWSAFTLITFSASALSVSVSVVHPVCNYANGSATANPSGGTPPYTYSWSNGATTQAIVDMVVGTYIVTVTDNVGATAQQTAYLVNFGLDVAGTFSASPACTPCTGEMTFDTTQFRGVSPYTFTPAASFYVGSVAHIAGLCTGPATVTMLDANGCSGGVSGIPIGNPAIAVIEYPEILPGCNGQPNGAATIRISDEIGNWFLPGEVTVSGPSGTVYQDTPAEPIVGYTDILLSALVPGNYTVGGTTTTYCGPVPFSSSFTVPDIGPDCGYITGTVYVDMDQDCALDASDFPLAYHVLEIDNGTEYAITNASGTYLRALGYGAYTMEQVAGGLEQLCPAQDPILFNLDNTTQFAVIDIADSSTAPFDMNVHCWLYPVSPGLETAVHIDMQNYTYYPSGAVDLTLSIPWYFTFVTANVAPATVSTGQLTWNLAGLSAFDGEHIHVTFLVDMDVSLIGGTASISAIAQAAASEQDLGNNTCATDQLITAAFDPNDKQGITSSGLSHNQYFLAQDEWIDYTVRFQNTGNAAATDVVIRDTLDTDLDIATLQILGASHTFTPSLDFGRELVFRFDDINLPDSGSNFLGSQGFISYRIKPNSDIIVGDVLENTAAIYFDINPPVITNTTSHVVDFSTGTQAQEQEQGQMILVPNPVSEVLNVILPDGADGALELLTMDGRRIALPATRRANGIQLDVRSLTTGLYMIRTAQGTTRFVKQ